MNLSHYAKSILSILAAVFGILVVALTDDVVTTTELVNVAITLVTAIGVYWAVNVPGTALAYFKGTVAVLGAALVALASFLSDGVTASEWLQIMLAGLTAIGVVIVPNEPPLVFALPSAVQKQ